jgi:hypothetical protein
MKSKEPTLAERQSMAAKAREAQLQKARAKSPVNDPGFAERQAERQAVGIAREARAAERKAAKLADQARKEAQRIAEEAARAIALKGEQETREAQRAEREAREIALQAERKAERDARYAARKARKK